jgi:hypothetical protein
LRFEEALTGPFLFVATGFGAWNPGEDDEPGGGKEEDGKPEGAKVGGEEIGQEGKRVLLLEEEIPGQEEGEGGVWFKVVAREVEDG